LGGDPDVDFSRQTHGLAQTARFWAQGPDVFSMPYCKGPTGGGNGVRKPRRIGPETFELFHGGGNSSECLSVAGFCAARWFRRSGVIHEGASNGGLRACSSNRGTKSRVCWLKNQFFALVNIVDLNVTGWGPVTIMRRKVSTPSEECGAGPGPR